MLLGMLGCKSKHEQKLIQGGPAAAMDVTDDPKMQVALESFKTYVKTKYPGTNFLQAGTIGDQLSCEHSDFKIGQVVNAGENANQILGVLITTATRAGGSLVNKASMTVSFSQQGANWTCLDGESAGVEHLHRTDGTAVQDPDRKMNSVCSDLWECAGKPVGL